MNKHVRGWDYFTPENAEDFDIQKCRVCDKKFDVKPNQFGATGFAEGMAGRGHKHDILECKHAGEPWHNQVLALKMLAQKTASKTLEKIYLDEAKAIIKTKIATKDIKVGAFTDYF